jgi:glycosyltransferase EpsD
VSKRIDQSAGKTERKKILFTASTMSHIENFHRPYLNAFEEMGWEVDAVALPVSKSFFSLKNIGAINYTRKLLKEGGYDVISSHATLAGIVTRLGVILAGKSKLSKKSSNPKHGLKVFHTAHGYLFHDDKSIKKWAYLLPEIICSKVTDVLMVMNHEDLDIARKYKLCKEPENIHYINGMGIDLSRFQTANGKPLQCTKEQKEAFGITDDDFVFVYAAEFSKRKNHELLLRGFAETVKQLDRASNQEPRVQAEQGDESSGSSTNQAAGLEQKDPGRKKNLKLVLAGDGALFEEMKTLAADLEIRDRVVFLGYIKNVHELYPCCDAAVSTSRIEGLPFNIMEAMACGLPVVASDIKGHRELVEHGVNGLLFSKGNQEQIAILLLEMIYNPNVRHSLFTLSQNKIEEFSLSKVLPQIIKIYNTYFNK